MGEQRIKLIQVIADSSMGGGPKHVLGILSNIDQKIFEPFLICPPGYLSAEGKLLSGVKVFNFNPRSKFDVVALCGLRQIIHKILSSNDPFGPAIVHAHGPRAGLLSRWAVPSIVKTVYTEHIFNENYHLKNPINEFIQKFFLKRQNKRVDCIIAVSRSVKEFIIKAGMADMGKVVVIPNGIKCKKASQARRIDSRHPVLGAIGNLNHQKGYSYLVDAMANVVKRFPTATLEIIGEGEDRPVLEDQIKKLNLQKNVTLLGYKNLLDKYFKRWDIYIMPSTSETFGIAALEAMQAGVPVIASRIGGLKDIITNGKNGILVEPRREDILAKSIMGLLQSPATMAKLKREGMVRAKDFDWGKIIKKIEEQYLKLFR